MATKSDVLAALTALGAAISAAVAQLQKPVETPPPVEDTEFEGQIADSLSSMAKQLTDALNPPPSNTEPEPAPVPVGAFRPTPTGTRAPGTPRMGPRPPAKPELVACGCGVTYNTGTQSAECPHKPLNPANPVG